MKFEFSAGGIVSKEENGLQLILVVQHAQYGHWSFPKGHIGDTIHGETKEQAALREVKEETGVTAEILQEISPQEYWYQRDREKRKKTVYYFLMKFLKESPERDFEMEKVEWVPEGEVLDLLTFPGDKKTWLEAREHKVLLDQASK